MFPVQAKVKSISMAMTDIRKVIIPDIIIL